jgi:hypothetical protein
MEPYGGAMNPYYKTVRVAEKCALCYYKNYNVEKY